MEQKCVKKWSTDGLTVDLCTDHKLHQRVCRAALLCLDSVVTALALAITNSIHITCTVGFCHRVIEISCTYHLWYLKVNLVNQFVYSFIIPQTFTFWSSLPQKWVGRMAVLDAFCYGCLVESFFHLSPTYPFVESFNTYTFLFHCAFSSADFPCARIGVGDSHPPQPSCLWQYVVQTSLWSYGVIYLFRVYLGTIAIYHCHCVLILRLWCLWLQVWLHCLWILRLAT